MKSNRGGWEVLILASTVSLIVTACVTAKHSAVEPLHEFSTIRFLDWTGLSPKVREQQNLLFHVPDDVAVEKESGIVSCPVNLFPFRGFTLQTVQFTGDAARFNNLIEELLFLQEHGVMDYADSAGRGMADDFESLFKGVWELVTSPIKVVEGIGTGAVELAKYVGNAIQGGEDVRGDLYRVAKAYYDNKMAEVAKGYGVDSELIILPETRDTLSRLTKTRIAGVASVEIATAFLAVAKLPKLGPIVEVTDAVPQVEKLEKGSDLLRMGKLFPLGERILASRQRAAEFSKLAAALDSELSRVLGKTIDPRRLAGNEGKRAAARYVNQAMYVLNAGEKAGRPPGTLIDEALTFSGADREIGEFYHDPVLAKKAVLGNYTRAKEFGIFDDPENLRKLQFGNAATVKRGAYAGQTLEVDHIIPVGLDPSMSANIANLKYLPASLNRSKGKKLTNEAISLARELNQAVGYKPPFAVPKIAVEASH